MKRAGYTYASFSNVTVADLGALASLEVGVTEMLTILPLLNLLELELS